MVKSLEITGNYVTILDQTLLPHEERYIEIHTCREMIDAIRRMSIRGAPALGIAATAAAWLAVQEFTGSSNFQGYFEQQLQAIEDSRPTAVNLFTAIAHIRKTIADIDSPAEAESRILDCLRALIRYEINACVTMGENGAKLFQHNKLNILTICNTGSLATVGIGTALGVIRSIPRHLIDTVFALETRPKLQGARLTMWELEKSGIPAKLITDGMVADVMSRFRIAACIVGADRIAANGDTANKIGTFSLAVQAQHFKIPFYVAAPETTFDRSLTDGSGINIEQRNSSEVTSFAGTTSATENCRVYNPAFDVTPAGLITAIITDKEVYRAPYSF
ncbi:MAG: S-methyl-5-thioribose-1-phosphate isomerase [Candidatus Cloacimonetes bacterium]|nr:S-methyl-5-thioribose-1-phosphate isomerase [Candidatus Cloacimonadota bacterium]